MTIQLPENVEAVIAALESGGYQACAVGGCVRDSLMGGHPVDWDVCTSARPEQTARCFTDFPVIETGLRHGTVTVVMHGKPIEITTYRVDGDYSDHRRPDHVAFVQDLTADLSRRDFTINAMAYHPRDGLVDEFEGLSDLAGRIIRCVGEPERRFQEDALRILRALRFASALGFAIEPRTSAALRASAPLLRKIAAERVARELDKLLAGPGAASVLLEYTDVIGVVIPEILEMVDFNQNTRYHHLDVWRHTVASIDAAPAGDKIVRLALLFHDIAKPRCYTETNGVGHFHGHPKPGADMARAILTRLRYDSATIDAVTTLVEHHDAPLPPEARPVKRRLNRLGESALRRLLAVKRADTLAHAPEHRQDRLQTLDKVSALLDEILAQGQCFQLKDLAVTGHDLIALGIPAGPEVGVVLDTLMDMVIDERVGNTRAELLEAAKGFM